MDNSQDSDVLSKSEDFFIINPSDPMVIDAITYDSFVSSTTQALSSIQHDVRKPSFSSHFSTLLDDCSACIYQSLDLITDILLSSDIDTQKLKEYINNIVTILQSLSTLIKHVVESATITCEGMKIFPTAVGCILSKVFAHCKNSENMYEVHLNNVEKQLRELFKTCHELQLTYLMVLEKHFIFDLTQTEEQDILIEALDINLKICEIVQSLDVKTMGEQWKAYTVLCEKYASNLLDKDVNCDCTAVLCSMLMSNIKTALQENEDNKLMLRSLKVGSFALRILVKVCTIFRHAVKKDYVMILELLLLIYMNTGAYLEAVFGKPSQFVGLFDTHITVPATCLLTELTLDEKFLNCFLAYDVYTMRREDNLLGYILTTILIIKILLHRSDDQISKQRIINCVFKFLPLCHVWFNMDIKFKSGPYQTHGLYEQFLNHTIALVVTMDSEGINVLERRMIEAILSTDCYSAMFSSNLWTLLARMSSRQLLFNQVIALIKMYQKLENNPLFLDSPQYVHLSYTMKRLYEIMTYEDKIQVYNMFEIQGDQYIGLWSVLGLNILPRELHSNIDQFAMDKIKGTLRKLVTYGNVDIDEVNKIVNFAYTCLRINNVKKDPEFEDLLIKAWIKACPKNNRQIAENLNRGTVWYYRYVKGLVSITNTMSDIHEENLVKVLQIISSLIQYGSTELKLLVINTFCKLANLPMRGTIQKAVEPILTDTFVELFKDSDAIVKNKLYNELRGARNSYLNSVIDRVNLSNASWTHFKTHGTLNKDSNIKQHLESAMKFEYNHNCIENGEIINIVDSGSDVAGVSKVKSNSSNFDFADINTLFEPENSEPVCKKAKLESDDVVDEIISRLEADAHFLSKIKENVFTAEYQKRIKKICNKLINLSDV